MHDVVSCLIVEFMPLFLIDYLCRALQKHTVDNGKVSPHLVERGQGFERNMLPTVRGQTACDIRHCFVLGQARLF